MPFPSGSTACFLTPSFAATLASSLPLSSPRAGTTRTRLPTSFTSRDVKWSLDTTVNGTVTTVKAAAFKSLKSVDAPDATTVIVHLKTPDTSLLLNVCDAAFGVIPYGSGRDFWRHPVGSGAFTFVSQEQDKNVLVQRNRFKTSASTWCPMPSPARSNCRKVPRTSR
jgi:ABC-type transport system substrate-binding protein